MDLNKELITRAILGIVLCYVFLKMSQYLLSSFKKKLPGYKSAENDIDMMIKRQEDKIRNQYGIGIKTNSLDKYTLDKNIVENAKADPKELEAIFKEASWGGGELVKKIKASISQNYAYTLSDSKINAFILLAKSKKYFQYLSADHIEKEENLAQFIATSLVFHMLVDEIKNQEPALLDMFARKSALSSQKLQLALQIKIITHAKITPPLKDERKYSTKILLNSISEETLQQALLVIIQREANLWAKGPSLFAEELSLYLVYAEIICPLPALKNKFDLESALMILELEEAASLEEIKKAYKKKALFFHPDKIGQMKLSPYLVAVANKKFNTIKEAYDMLVSKRS